MPASIRRLNLHNFRNYHAASLETDAPTIVLVGPNGAGKTNLIEAISFLAPGRGLRRATLNEVAFSEGDDADDLPEICEKLRTLMPQDGEPRGDAANIYLHALNRCIELAAASVAERMLLPGEPVPSVSDEQAVELASLCCQSAEAIERFLALAEQQAHDLIYPHVPIIMSLATVLRIQRTLTGEEIDNVIATTHARLVLAAERVRRRDWERRLENAKAFKCETTRDINEG